MTKLQLNASGVDAKIKQLYKLDFAKTAKELDALSRDFKSWLKANFELSMAETKYLEKLSDSTLRYLACQLHAAILCRIPVTYENEEFEAKKHGSKRLVIKSGIVASFDEKEQLQLSGKFKFEIQYVKN